MSLDASRYRIVGIGELLWDCFLGTKRPGGAPANVVYHARLLGSDGIICSRVGSDAEGAGLINHLQLRGVDTTYVQTDSEHPTSTVTVEFERPDHPTYTIHENIAWDHLEYTDTYASLMSSASAICFGTLAQRSLQSRTSIHKCLHAGGNSIKVYDVNIRPPWYHLEAIEQSLRLADVVKLNTDEVRLLGREIQGKEMTLDNFSHWLITNHGVRIICVTRGDKGCVVFDRSQEYDIPGQKISLADPVGAGDAFTAGFIHGLVRDWPLEQSAHLANTVGALVAGKTGAMPDLSKEYAQLTRE